MSRRRDFLKQGAAAFASTVFLGMSTSASEGGPASVSQQQPGRFIDAHSHIWTNDFNKYPLAKGYTVKDMDPPVFRAEHILRYARPSGVGRVVLIQMIYYGFDNSYILDSIRGRPSVFRGVAVVDWNSRDPDVKMRELAKHGIRGFRLYPPDESTGNWMATEGSAKMFRCGAEEGLSMCLLVNPVNLSAVDRQCDEYPDTPVLIDHLARIGATGTIKESDVKALCHLARHRNVKVKVSAFYALGRKKPPHLELVPMIKQVYEAFGPQRLMWASDCPFQIMHETYDDSIALVRDHLPFLSGEDKQWMLHRTAEETFFT